MSQFTSKQAINIACCSISEKYGLSICFYRNEVAYSICFKYEDESGYVMIVTLVDDRVEVRASEKQIIKVRRTPDYYYNELDKIIFSITKKRHRQFS